jgi:phage-related protein
VIFCRTGEGKCPVEKFLDSLPGKAARKVTWVLKLLEDLERVPSVYLKKWAGTEEIWELRMTLGSNTYRILCLFADHATVVLTHGFMKKSRTTPLSEASKAEAMRREFLERRRT